MKRFISLAVLLVGAANCQGGFLFSGTAGTIPGGQTNELIEPVIDFVEGTPGQTSLDGLFDSDIGLSGNVKEVTFTFYGAEAGFLNQFWVTGQGLLFTHTGGEEHIGSGTGFTATSFTFDAADLDASDLFKFVIPDNGQTVSSNANNENTPGLANYFTYLVNGSSKDILLFLDDAGAGDDDNHDDMVIRISAVVPEPGTASLALASLALGGLTFRRRR